MTKQIVIIGGGQAGLQAITSLRQSGFDGDITLIGAEAFLPYQRPPLSKAYLAGKMDRERLFLKPQRFFDDNKVVMHLGCVVQSVDAAARTISFDGDTIRYDVLVLATGSRPRDFALRPADAQNIFNVRTIDDIDAMLPYFKADKRLTIIGGGYIGLEAAAIACQMGVRATILEAAPRLLARVAEPEISAFYHNLHSGEGARIITDCRISGFTAAPDITHVCCEGGADIEADFVITGIGVVPNVELARDAGVVCENGIVVDGHGCTSDAAIYAIGDCSRHYNALLRRDLRLESVPNAIEQAKAAAAHIVGAPKPYAQIPWFWSDQYDVKLQIAGVPERVDKKVLRGDDKTRSFAWFYFTGDVLSGVMAVNRAAEFLAGRALIHKAVAGLKIDPAMLADETSAPKSWMQL